MAKNSKALIFIGFGAVAIITGTAILCSGGFKSIMIDPTDGPLTATAAPYNAGHYQQLLLNYPEMFNCATLDDDIYANSGAEYTSYYIASEDVRDNARAYCRFHDGEQAWTFALYLPIALIVLGLAVASFLRKSGYTVGLVGVGLSAVMLAFTLLVLVHYEGHSYVPQAIQHFTDCENFDAATITEITGITTDVAATDNTAPSGTITANAYNGSLQGPVPRRGWLCTGHWDYDSDLKTAAFLVYGGAAVNFVGFLSLMIAFAYLVQPFVTPVASFAKAPAAVASFRGADDVDFDSASEYTYTDEEY